MAMKIGVYVPSCKFVAMISVYARFGAWEL